MKLLWHFVFKLSECGVLVCEAACRVHCPPVFPAAVAPSPSCPTCSTPARTHSLLPSPFFSFLGVSLARLGEIIFVGTLLQLASHKSAVGACLFSQHTFWHHTHTHTLRSSSKLWAHWLSKPGVHPASHRAFWGSGAAKDTHTWDRINNLYLCVFVRNAWLDLCCRVKGLRGEMACWGGKQRTSRSFERRRCHKNSTQRKNQTERAKRQVSI